MDEIEQAVINSDRTICENIDTIGATKKDLVYQNILNGLRTFLEAIALRIYNSDNNCQPSYSYDCIKTALKYISSVDRYGEIARFHSFLQRSKSHFSSDDDDAERLMIRYFEMLVKTKRIYFERFHSEVLHNIAKLSPETDPGLIDHYRKILQQIHRLSLFQTDLSNNRYYVQKRKPVFVDGELLYEITLSQANDFATKFDRKIAFTAADILPNYSIKASLHEAQIDLFGKPIPIEIISDWSVSIRPCEFTNLLSLLGVSGRISASSREYQAINNFLTARRTTLTQLLALPNADYSKTKKELCLEAKATPIFDGFDKIRAKIVKGEAGANAFRYLLFFMNNRIIKDQAARPSENDYANCNLSSKVYPFDSMPFCSSLRNHNPRLSDVISCIDPEEHEEEFLARIIQTNTTVRGRLYTPADQIKLDDSIDPLAEKFNGRLSPSTEARRICRIGKNYYIKGPEDDTLFILSALCRKASETILGNRSTAEEWISQSPCPVDDEEKKEILLNLFDKTSVALVYGAAGTGKSTLISHVAAIYSDSEKLILTNTHPALENLQRRVKTAKTEFSTIASFQSSRHFKRDYDVVVIDECSTVSNNDMKKFLTKCSFRLLLLAGDTYQIESIKFGNWFSVAQSVLPKDSFNELKIPHRTDDPVLLDLWGKVRKLDPSVYELLCRKGFAHPLDETIFQPSSDDEIILCLNYDGLYGVNSINSFLQSSRPGKEFRMDIWPFKVGDPILFNETERFAPVLYNNLKGRITNIEEDEETMYFSVRIPKAVNEMDTSQVGLALIESSANSSVIRFPVRKKRDSDEDDSSLKETVVPFQVAYAVSIHKAQGLEFDSVKIVITNEIEEMITHNIFYTAITRAKRKLAIYWSPETQKYVLDNLHLMYDKNDEKILLSRFNDYQKRSQLEAEQIS